MGVLDFMQTLKAGGSWWELCILASTAAILIYALLYSIAHAFNFDNLKRSSKSEILQSIATLFMVLFIFTMVGQVETFSISTFLGTNSYVVCQDETTITANIQSTLDIIKCRFKERAKELAERHEQVYASASSGYSVFDRLSIYMSIAGIPIFQGNWVADWYHEAETYRLLNNFITVVLIGANSIIAMVNYIGANMLTVFLPFGLFMRSFKYTRGIGALFMSLAIGFYFIFPILFVMTDPGFVEVPNLPAPTSINEDSNFCFPTFNGIVSQAYQTGSTVQSVANTASLTNTRNSIAKFYVYMTTHAFVVFSITLVFVRYMMVLFGGESYDIMKFVAKVI